jgi:hypothetical protein
VAVLKKKKFKKKNKTKKKMKSNVRNYTTQQILDRIKSLDSFKYIPSGPMTVDVRSNEDEPDRFDDKKYFFDTQRCDLVMSCTTNAGLKALRNPFRFNSRGVAVVKSDEIYYDAFEKSDGRRIRHHNGKIQCLRQIADMFYYRDANGDANIDEVGRIYKGNYSTNQHPNTYSWTRRTMKYFVGTWSYGCSVVNDLNKYWKMMKRIPLKTKVTHVILREWEV